MLIGPSTMTGTFGMRPSRSSAVRACSTPAVLSIANAAMTTRERDDVLSRVSLALGRLTARARRGRSLATRGGEVTGVRYLLEFAAEPAFA